MMFTKDEKVLLIQWLNTLFAQELTKQQCQQYFKGDYSPFFEYLKEIGIQDAEEMEQTILSLQMDPDAHLELSADFAQCFLLDGKISALPYASQYLDEKTQTSHFQLMDTYLEQFKLQINKENKEPSDHLCVYLSLLLKCLEEQEKETTDFIQKALFPWIEKFQIKLHKVPTKTRFYQKAIDVLVNILKS